MASRQVGKTQTMAAFFLWYTIFNPNKTCAVLANKAMVAKEILDRYKTAYENLPKFLQHGVVSFNRTSVELENKSRVITASTSSSAIRGFSISCLALDEFAFVNTSVAEEFFTSVYPTISSGKETKILISSTPNGFNHFYKLWNEAEANINGFKPLCINWDAVPGRDLKWKEDQIATLGEEKFSQEYENEFIGGKNTLIGGRYLKTLSPVKPIQSSDSLHIYAKPEKGQRYIIVCDPSRGVGNDDSAFIVFNVTEFPITIAATYYDANVSPIVLPTILERLGYTYNDASILVEINDNGQQVADILWRDLEYEETLIIETRKKKREYGIRTTKRIKAQGCTLLKNMIESQKLIVQDMELISQISSFIQKRNSYEADAGHHDDLVMCCVLMAWFSSTDLFTSLTDQNFRNQYRDQKMNEIDQNMLPFGFIDDGLDDDMDINTTEIIDFPVIFDSSW
jgi:hypothetical protein